MTKIEVKGFAITKTEKRIKLNKAKVYNVKFVDVYNHLKKTGKVKNKSQLGEIIGAKSHCINYMLTGNKQITVVQLTKLIAHYGINANYIFGRSSFMFMKDVIIKVGAPGESIRPQNGKSYREWKKTVKNHEND